MTRWDGIYMDIFTMITMTPKTIILLIFFIGLMLLPQPSHAQGGDFRFAKRFGGTGGDVGYSLTVDDSGNIYVTGWFHDTVDFGGGNLTSISSNDSFLAKYTADGNHIWSKQFAGEAGTYIYSQGVDTDNVGNTYITGFFGGTVDFGGGDLTSDQGIFLASYTADGTHRWSKRFGPGIATGFSINVDDSGNLYVTGSFRDTVDFGGGNLTSKSTNGLDILLASYDTYGNHRWSKGFGGTGGTGYSVDVDGVGNVYLTGDFRGTINFGGDDLIDTSTGTYTRIYGSSMLVSFDTQGNHRWSKGFGAGRGTNVIVDGNDNIYLTGNLGGTVDFGGGNMTSAGEEDGFLASYTANGTLSNSRFGNFAGIQPLFALVY